MAFIFAISDFEDIMHLDDRDDIYHPFKPGNYLSDPDILESFRQIYYCIDEYFNSEFKGQDGDVSENCIANGDVLRGFVNSNSDLAEESMHLSHFGGDFSGPIESLIAPFCEDVFSNLLYDVIWPGDHQEDCHSCK